MPGSIRMASLGILCAAALGVAGCGLFRSVGRDGHASAAPEAPGPDLVVQEAPPPPRDEARPACPGPAYAWCSGHWAWQNGRYAWAPGRWAVPPRRAALWVPAHWTQTPAGWRFVPGQWR